MAYVFSDQVLAKASITDTDHQTFTIQGIAATETDANIVRGGISTLLDIVGWSIKDAVRVVNQDIVEDSE